MTAVANPSLLERHERVLLTGLPNCATSHHALFVWRLASNRELMGEYANGHTFNLLAGATVLATSTLSLLLLGVTFSGSL
jgi:hypothetical protein